MGESAEPGHVFISYSRGDRAFVESLAAQLEAAGIPVWFDRAVAAGDRWDQVVSDHIKVCGAFIAVMTPESVSSQWVRLEIARAHDLGRPLLPVLPDPAVKPDLPLRLADRHFEDVSAGRLSPSFLDHVRRLLESSGAAPEPPVPRRSRPPRTSAGLRVPGRMCWRIRSRTSWTLPGRPTA